MSRSRDVLRIGGASGYWGDAAHATAQLLDDGDLDFLVYDYLAEITMSILARARAADPAMGYATDFVTAAMAPNLARLHETGVRVVANAGGVNPSACAARLREVIAGAGLPLTVACVLGDDLLDRCDELAGRALTEMATGAAFPEPERVQSINAYLGAVPVARALDTGANIVVTGRGVDSAVTLGACLHRYGWPHDDWDRLAAGALAGHLLECGTQLTGGNFTDWETTAADIDTLGYPIAEIDAEGGLVCTKARGTGGRVSVGTVAEQLLYEIGDPRSYRLPDVTCDLSHVRIEPAGPDRVAVRGVRGRAPGDSYKMCATWHDGFRGGALMTFYGEQAGRKAHALAAAALRAARRRLAQRGLAGFTETSVEVLGTQSQFGRFAAGGEAREVVLKLAARHETAAGVGVLLTEAVGLGLAAPPGLSGFQGTRQKPSPVVRAWSFLLPKRDVPVWLETADDRVELDAPVWQGDAPPAPPRPAPPPAPSPDGLTDVPLRSLAWARSGDKGNTANVGVIARRAEYLPFVWHALSEKAVTERFAHFFGPQGRVERFALPGCHAVNLLLHDVLGGGGIASLRNDPQGKGFAQLVLAMPVAVPRQMAATLAGAGEEDA